MPFLKEGGVFISTDEYFDLGTKIKVNILLPDTLKSSCVKGEVCWLTPIGTQNGTPVGIGISFTDDPDKIHDQIKEALAGQIHSSEPTLTM